MKSLMMAAAVVLSSGTVLGEVFSWRHSETYSEGKLAAPNWKSFGDASNWAVGTDKTSANPDGRIPGPEDHLFYGNDSDTLKCFDLGGGDFRVKIARVSGAGMTTGLKLLPLRAGCSSLRIWFSLSAMAALESARMGGRLR